MPVCRNQSFEWIPHKEELPVCFEELPHCSSGIRAESMDTGFGQETPIADGAVVQVFHCLVQFARQVYQGRHPAGRGYFVNGAEHHLVFVVYQYVAPEAPSWFMLGNLMAHFLYRIFPGLLLIKPSVENSYCFCWPVSLGVVRNVSCKTCVSCSLTYPYRALFLIVALYGIDQILFFHQPQSVRDTQYNSCTVQN